MKKYWTKQFKCGRVDSRIGNYTGANRFLNHAKLCGGYWLWFGFHGIEAEITLFTG